MKKKILYCILLLAFISCQDEVKFNNPSFQGLKDGVFWRSIASKATLSNTGALTIEAYTRNEKITLKTNSKISNTYVLGTSTSNMASYALTDSSGAIITFSTGIGKGDGEIEITEYDIANKTITGIFRFNAENINNNPLYEPILNFQQGVFYKIPVN